MQRVVALIVLLIFASISIADAEELIKKGETLPLQRCIEISALRQPNVRAATSSVDSSRSRVGQSQSNYYPQINLSSGYSRISPVSPDTAVSGSSSSFDQYTSSLWLNQNIYDFGKTSSEVQIQKLNLDSSVSDLENVSQQTIYNVKLAYYGVIQAKHNRIVAEDTVKSTTLHLEQAKGFFEVGIRPKFDVTRAEVDLSNARLNLIRAENAFRIAVATLNNAMGVPEAPDYEIDDNLYFEKYEMTFEDAIDNAYGNRPDLASLVSKRQASEKSIDLAKTGYYPALSGNAAYNWGGEKFPLDDGWNVGVALSFPLFSGFLTTHQVAESRANLNVLTANEEFLKQSIYLEVQQAYLTLRAAEEAIPTAKLVVDQARENLDIANGRYLAGVGNPIEVTDAEVSLVNARTSYIQALYADKVAQASLEKAMGVK
ncbi:MAG TPA: TolC family protein [Nitrospiraceae bacterium]|nr:TolC family protein [Nitrospiraceae bacterium]